jgi:hypothetical protein
LLGNVRCAIFQRDKCPRSDLRTLASQTAEVRGPPKTKMGYRNYIDILPVLIWEMFILAFAPFRICGMG